MIRTGKQLHSGLTLIEVLLSVTVLVILSSMTIPVYHSFKTRNDLDIMEYTIVQTMRRAQALAQAIDGDMSWGVFIQEGDIILFKGLTFPTRDPNYDEIFEVSSGVAISGLTEIVFAKFSGYPLSPGTTTLTASSGETRLIFVNAKGIIDY